MRLPSQFTSAILEARQNGGGPNDTGSPCDCLSGGAISGIVIGSIAGFFLLYWLIKFWYDSSKQTETVTQYERPTSGHRSRRSFYYDESSPPMSRRRKYRRDIIDVERPPKVYLNRVH
ncbi:hypothetical protein VTO42DRAFT_598 [Malbranchea cinnamomea]